MINFPTNSSYSCRCASFFGCLSMMLAFSCAAQTVAPVSLSPSVSPLAVNTVDLTTAPPSPELQGVPNNRELGHVIKKKILATAFALVKPAQLDDIDDMAQGFPRELLRRLELSGQFLSRSSPNLLSFGLQQVTPDAKLVRQVAAEHDSQFVLAGEIRNAGLREDKKFFGLWTTRKRQIEIEFAIYDGVSGALLARHTLNQQAGGKAYVGRDKVFASAAFFAGGYGQAINALLDEAAQLIAQDLRPYPVLAKILKMGNGQIVLDAGATSAISPGDLATVLAAFNELPSMGLAAEQSSPLLYGRPQYSLGKMAIIQVQYLFSVGELSAEVRADELKVGDFVRFDNLLLK